MPLDNEHVQAGFGQITGGNAPVVACTYHNDVCALECFSFFLPIICHGFRLL
jgi:hypothetical protein